MSDEEAALALEALDALRVKVAATDTGKMNRASALAARITYSARVFGPDWLREHL